MKVILALLLLGALFCFAQEQSESSYQKRLSIATHEDSASVIAYPIENSEQSNRFILKFSVADYPVWSLASYDASGLPSNTEESSEDNKLFEFSFLMRRLVQIDEEMSEESGEEASEESGEEASEESSEESSIESSGPVCFGPKAQILQQINLNSFQGQWSNIEESSEDAEASDGSTVKVYTLTTEKSLPLGVSIQLKTHVAEAPVMFKNKLIGPGRCKIELVLADLPLVSIPSGKFALLTVLNASQPVSSVNLEDSEKLLYFANSGEFEWFDVLMTGQGEKNLESASFMPYNLILRGEEESAEESSEEGSAEGSAEESSEESSLYGLAFCVMPNKQLESSVDTTDISWGPFMEVYDSDEVSIEEEFGEEAGEESGEESGEEAGEEAGESNP